MRRILLATAVTLAAMSSVQPVFAMLSANALVPNALVPNALVPNALVPNALVPNGLTSGTTSLAGSVDQVTSIVLPSGEIIN